MFNLFKNNAKLIDELNAKKKELIQQEKICDDKWESLNRQRQDFARDQEKLHSKFSKWEDELSQREKKHEQEKNSIDVGLIRANLVLQNNKTMNDLIMQENEFFRARNSQLGETIKQINEVNSSFADKNAGLCKQIESYNLTDKDSLIEKLNQRIHDLECEIARLTPVKGVLS